MAAGQLQLISAGFQNQVFAEQTKHSRLEVCWRQVSGDIRVGFLEHSFCSWATNSPATPKSVLGDQVPPRHLDRVEHKSCLRYALAVAITTNKKERSAKEPRWLA